MPDGRGGYQRPEHPAAWSGPGHLSQRTDGNEPGRISGLPYGENAPANQLLQAARQPGQSGVGAPPSQPPGGGAPGGANLPDVFGPTNRPDEPITAGAPGSEPSVIPTDDASVIRAAYRAHPTPELERLLERFTRA